MTAAFRDAIAVRRLNVMRARRAAALERIAAETAEAAAVDRASAFCAGHRNSNRDPLNDLFRAIGAEPLSPDELTVLVDGKPGVH